MSEGVCVCVCVCARAQGSVGEMQPMESVCGLVCLCVC